MLILLLLVTTTACQSELSVLFTNVSHEDFLRDFHEPIGKTEFLVFITPQDAERFIAHELHVDPAFQEQQFRFAQRIRDVDFTQAFALLVLQGRQGSADYGVRVDRISQAGSMLRIKATFIDPNQPDTWWEYIFGPSGIRRPMATDPYDLISVSKSASPAPVTTMELWSRGQLVATLHQALP